MPDSPHAWSTLLLTAHWLVVVTLSLRVVARRLSVGVSLAWLAVVFSVPFLGALAYLMFGGKRLGGARERRHLEALARADEVLEEAAGGPHAGQPFDGAIGESLARATTGLLGTPLLTGHTMELLTGYEAVFSAWIADIDRARESVRLAFYIWHDGGRADDVAQALVRARARGVRCRVLLDAAGSARFFRGPTVDVLREAGVEVVAALPRSFVRRADLRNHRKIVVVDGRVCYTGSQNLVDPRYFKQSAGVGEWVDAVVRVEGPAVAPVASTFEVDWAVETRTDYVAPASPTGPSTDRSAAVQVVASGPAPHPDGIRQLLLTAIYSARRELVLTTPYFVPDEQTLTALLSAANRGVSVTVIVPARNDSVLVRYASAAQYDDLLAAGVRIALFQGGLLHTKSMVVDGGLTLFGSVNLDMRSFWLNFEISLFVYDVEFAERVRALQDGYLARSSFVDPDAWRARPAWRRFPENAARLVGPLL